MKKPHSKALKLPEWQTTNRNMMKSVSMCVFHTVGWSAVASLCLLCPSKTVIRKGPKHQHRKFPVISKMLFESQHNILRNKSTLELVTPLGQPRSVYKSIVECYFLESCEKKAKWHWRSRSITTIFNIAVNRISRCILGENLVILAQIHCKLLCRQTQFPRILRSPHPLGDYRTGGPAQQWFS